MPLSISIIYIAYKQVDFLIYALHFTDEGWRFPAIGNPNGEWDPEMNCEENGFRLTTGREDSGWPGIVNVRAYCFGVETQITSNNDLRGDYNRNMECWGKQKIVGIQVRKEIHHGITNFRVLCA